MIRTCSRTVAAVALLSACLWGRPTEALPQAIVVVTPLSFETSPPSPGTTVEITGKLRERINDEFLLFDTETPFVVSDTKTLKSVAALTPGRDNVVFVGVVQEKNSTLSVVVQSARKGASDREVFGRDLEALRAAERTTIGRFLELVRQIAIHAEKHQDESVLPILRKALRIAMERTRANAAKGAEVVTELRFVEQASAVLPENELPMIIELLIEIDERHPNNQDVMDRFRLLNCRRYRGKWLSHGEFKAAEGFVLVDGEWMLPEDADLRRAVQQFEKTSDDVLLLRRRTEREYKLLAQQGRIDVGMSRREIQEARGYPLRVRRRAVGSGELDQWTYADGHLYLFNGTLIEAPDGDAGQ